MKTGLRSVQSSLKCRSLMWGVHAEINAAFAPRIVRMSEDPFVRKAA